MCCLRRYAEVIDCGGSSHAEARMTVVALVVATAAARGRPSALGVSEIFLIAPPGKADPLAAMAWDGVSVPGSTDGEGTSIDVLTCASVAEELRAAASGARRAGVSGEVP